MANPKLDELLPFEMGGSPKFDALRLRPEVFAPRVVFAPVGGGGGGGIPMPRFVPGGRGFAPRPAPGGQNQPGIGQPQGQAPPQFSADVLGAPSRATSPTGGGSSRSAWNFGRESSSGTGGSPTQFPPNPKIFQDPVKSGANSSLGAEFILAGVSTGQIPILGFDPCATEKILKAVKQLGSDDPAERESAFKKVLVYLLICPTQTDLLINTRADMHDAEVVALVMELRETVQGLLKRLPCIARISSLFKLWKLVVNGWNGKDLVGTAFALGNFRRAVKELLAMDCLTDEERKEVKRIDDAQTIGHFMDFDLRLGNQLMEDLKKVKYSGGK